MRAPARLRTALRLLVPGLAVAVSLTALPAQAMSPLDRIGDESAPVATTAPASPSLMRATTSGVDRWTGYAFDACRAPSSAAMDRWRVASPFLGAGIYIGGALRACPQKHLTRGWVEHQTRQGWRLLPIWVGPQASCTSYHRRIASYPGARGRYPGARAQGVQAARGARAAATQLGLGRGTTLWYDLEWFRVGNTRCRNSSLHFLSAWTRELHRTGYLAGVYSSVSAGIASVGRERGNRSITAPDRVWFAWANGRQDVSWSKYLRAPGWKVDHRVHQYALDVSASYGGVRMAIDRNFVDLGASTEVRRTPAVCGRTADRSNYGLLRRGSHGSRVQAAQCLLRAAGTYHGDTGGSYGGETRTAVRAFQKAHGLRVTGRTDDRTWTALLAAGGTRPVLKRGSEGPAVRQLQRALTAALPGAVPVHGCFGPGTANAVRRYQARTGLRVSGVATPGTWHALRTGAPAAPRHHHGKAHHGKHHGKHQGKHRAAHGTHAHHKTAKPKHSKHEKAAKHGNHKKAPGKKHH